MKKQGFTLIELLAVIVILAIIALIATPIILGVIEDSKKKAFENTAYGLISSAEKTIARAQLENPNINGGSYTFANGVVTGTPTLEFTGEVPQSGNVNITADGKTEIAIWNGKYCVTKSKEESKVTFKTDATVDNCKLAGAVAVPYLDPILNGADPVLSEGMVPVVLAPDGTVTKANLNQKWYDYTNKEWANMILLSSDVRDTYKAGDTIDQAKILAYLVWVPRYKYAIPAGSGAREINIVFENKDTAKATGNALDTNYLTHPGFTFGTEELNGIWVGKFEMTGMASSPTVLPNERSLTNYPVATFFTASQLLNTETYGLTTTNDSHMIKNSEWGATSYLSHSKYGINTEIRINNSNTIVTGCAASVENANSQDWCQDRYNTVTGYLASTTGNITGIYDMSGGSWEIVMGNLNKTVGGSAISFSGLEDKYYDLYTSTTATTACNGGICYGHSLSETQGWNGDESDFSSLARYPWILRGGTYLNGASAGVFAFTGTPGGGTSSIGSRVVVCG